MAYQTLENFRFGWDTRRTALTSQPGTMLELVNMHVNEGAELEKREAFAIVCSLPAASYGAQVAGGKICVFSSAVNPGNLNALISWFRLQHPAVLQDANLYDAEKHLLTKIVTSTDFGGIPYAVAQFADRHVFHYWGESIVYQWQDGLTLDGYLTANNVADMVRETFTRALAGLPGYTVGGTNAVVDIKSPVEQNFTMTEVLDETTKLDPVLYSTGYNSTAGVPCSVTYKITGTSGGNNGTFDKFVLPDGSGGSFELALNVTLANGSGAGGIATALTAVKNLINSSLQTVKFTATLNAVMDEITIFSPLLNAESFSNAAIVLHHTYLTFIAPVATPLTISMSKYSLSGLKYVATETGESTVTTDAVRLTFTNVGTNPVTLSLTGHGSMTPVISSYVSGNATSGYYDLSFREIMGIGTSIVSVQITATDSSTPAKIGVAPIVLTVTMTVRFRSTTPPN
jgi:hypothetical protein